MGSKHLRAVAAPNISLQQVRRHASMTSAETITTGPVARGTNQASDLASRSQQLSDEFESAFRLVLDDWAPAILVVFRHYIADGCSESTLQKMLELCSDAGQYIAGGGA